MVSQPDEDGGEEQSKDCLDRLLASWAAPGAELDGAWTPGESSRPPSQLRAAEFSEHLAALAQVSRDEADLIFDNLDAERRGVVCLTRVRRWLLSQSFLPTLIHDCRCPDGHELSRFAPDIDGWCCADCGEDLAAGEDALSCEACDSLCWCLACAVNLGGQDTAEAVVSSASLAFLRATGRLAEEEEEEAESTLESTAETSDAQEDEEVRAEQLEEEILNFGAMKVRVGNCAGLHLAEIDAFGSWTIGALKLAIEEETGITHDSQTVVSSDLVRDDDELLAKAGVSGDVIEVLLLCLSEEQMKWLRMARNLQNHPSGPRSFLEQAPEEIRNDPLVVLETVFWCGMELQYASQELQADKKIALAAFKQNPAASAFIAPSLMGDRSFAHMLVAQTGAALSYLSPEFRDDRHLVLAAVRQHGMALASVELHSALLHDAEILETAFANGFRPRRNFLDVSSVALTAIQRDPNVMRSVSPRLCSETLFAHKVLAIDGNHLNDLSPTLWSNEFILSDATKNGFTFAGSRQEIRNCREVVCAVVSRRGMELRYVSPALRATRQVVMLAVQQAGMALQFAGHLLRNDRKIVEAAVMQNPEALRFAGGSLKHDSRLTLLSFGCA